MSPRDSKQFPKNNKDVDGNLPGQDLGEDSEDIDDSSGDSGDNSSGGSSSGDEINNRGWTRTRRWKSARATQTTTKGISHLTTYARDGGKIIGTGNRVARSSGKRGRNHGIEGTRAKNTTIC